LMLWAVGQRKVRALESARAKSQESHLFADDGDLIASHTPPLHVPPRRLSFSASTPRPLYKSVDGSGQSSAHRLAPKSPHQLSNSTRRGRFSLTPSQESKEKKLFTRDSVSTPYRSPGPDEQYESSLIELFPSRKLSLRSFDTPGVPELPKLGADGVSALNQRASAASLDSKLSLPLAEESSRPRAGAVAVVSRPPRKTLYRSPTVGACSQAEGILKDAVARPISLPAPIPTSTLDTSDQAGLSDDLHDNDTRVGVSRFEKRARLLASGDTLAKPAMYFSVGATRANASRNAVPRNSAGEIIDFRGAAHIPLTRVDHDVGAAKEASRTRTEVPFSKHVHFGIDELSAPGNEAPSSRAPVLPKALSQENENHGSISEVKGNHVADSTAVLASDSQSRLSRSAKQEDWTPDDTAHRIDDLRPGSGHPPHRGSMFPSKPVGSRKNDARFEAQTRGGNGLSGEDKPLTDGELSVEELEMARRVSNILSKVAPNKLPAALGRIEDRRLRAAVQRMLG
jgi:hypothetical protein